MSTPKEKFEEVTKYEFPVICADFSIEIGHLTHDYLLYLNYDPYELERFLYHIDVACNEVTGTIWFSDGSWVAIINDSWTHIKCPDKPSRRLIYDSDSD